MAYQRTEQYDEQTTEGLIENYRKIIGHLGEDPERQGLIKTPERMAKARQFMTKGYQQDAVTILNEARF